MCHVDLMLSNKDGEIPNMIGMVLYLYDNKQDWCLNGIHCKSGFIVIKLFDKVVNVNSKIGTLQNKLYKLIFNQELNDKVVGGGFAIHNGALKFNSSILNLGSKFHDNNRRMSKCEEDCIRYAMSQWQNYGIQNSSVKDVIDEISSKYCKDCWHLEGKYTINDSSRRFEQLD